MSGCRPSIQARVSAGRSVSVRCWKRKGVIGLIGSATPSMAEPANPNLLRLYNVLIDGFSVETRIYLPDGSYVDWVLSPLAGDRFVLTGTPVEVWGDAGSVGTANYPGAPTSYDCTREALLATLAQHLGPDPYVHGLPPALHRPRDPRVRFSHRLGNFTLDLPEGNRLQALLLLPFVFLLLVFLLALAALPLIDGWGGGNWVYGVLSIAGLALYGYLLIPFAVESLLGCAHMRVDGWTATITRGRSWWRRTQTFRWDHVESIALVVTRVKKFGASTTAQFVLQDGTRVDYATRMIRAPFDDAVKVLQSLLAARPTSRTTTR